MTQIVELTFDEVTMIGGAGFLQDAADFAKGVWEGICEEAHNLASGAL